jgi:hypothetical protein
MRTASRIVAAAFVALGLLAASATANRAIEIEPVGEITKVSEDFTITAFGGEVRIRCRLILRGSLGPQIQKIRALPEGRFGQIRSAATEGCRSNLGGARVIVLIEANRPLNLRYESFLGNLPNITGILFRKLAFEFKVSEAVVGNCLYRGDVGLLITFPPVEDGAGNRFNQERFNIPNSVPVIEGMLCPESVELSGRGRVTPAQRVILVAD